MDHTEVRRYWDENADAWTRLARAGYDVYRDYLNTPAFFEMLPDVKGLSGLDIGCGEGHNTRLLAEVCARVTASVSDDSEIESMIAYWEIGGQGKEVSMERIDDQTYSATIGPVNSTGELFIEIRGKDVMGNVGKSKPVFITVSKCIG